MKPTTDQLYSKIVKVSQNVRERLRTNGMVAPVKNANGTISVGLYTVIKAKTGFYSVTDHAGETVVSGINLPQTAAITANSLALGKFLDRRLLERDRDYGYALFEESLHWHAAERNYKNDPDHVDIMMTKYLIARTKKEQHKKYIVNNFDKLNKLA